jgi:hypothetical protein
LKEFRTDDFSGLSVIFPAPFVYEKIKFLKFIWNVTLYFIYLIQAHAIDIRGDEQGLDVKINRIVLQTLTFTFGIFGIAPAISGDHSFIRQ